MLFRCEPGEHEAARAVGRNREGADSVQRGVFLQRKHHGFAGNEPGARHDDGLARRVVALVGMDDSRVGRRAGVRNQHDLSTHRRAGLADGVKADARGAQRQVEPTRGHVGVGRAADDGAAGRRHGAHGVVALDGRIRDHVDAGNPSDPVILAGGRTILQYDESRRCYLREVSAGPGNETANQRGLRFGIVGALIWRSGPEYAAPEHRLAKVCCNRGVTEQRVRLTRRVIRKRRHDERGIAAQDGGSQIDGLSRSVVGAVGIAKGSHNLGAPGRIARRAVNKNLLRVHQRVRDSDAEQQRDGSCERNK